MKRIIADIKNQTFVNVYLLYGPERYLCRYYTNELANALGDIRDEMNSTVYNGKNIDIPKLIDTAQTLPFFAPRRLIVIKDSGVFKSSNEMLADYLKEIAEDTFFVFCEEEVDKRNKVYKAVEKAGYVAYFDRLDSNGLSRWTANYFARFGKKITNGNMQYLLERIGNDMDTIRNESDKLISYLGEREIIEKDDIEVMVAPNINAKTYEMTDCIAAGNTNGALKIYKELMALKVAPEAIMSSVITMFKQLYEIKTYKGSADMARTLSMQPFVASKYQKIARSFSADKLLEAANFGAELVVDVRTGKLDKMMCVELFIVKYSDRNNR